jgi:hypothetical protein
MAEHLLDVDYKADWEYMDGVESVQFEFGPQRNVIGGLTAPSESKMRRTSPNQEALTYGTGLAWEPKGQSVVLFVDTLRSGGPTGVRIIPHSGDKILAFDGYWIIQSVKLVADQSQWKMLLEQSTKTPKDYLEDNVDDGVSGLGSMIVGSSFVVR